MTDQQKNTLKLMRRILKAENNHVTVEEEENGDRVFISFQRPGRESFVGWYTILPDGTSKFGR